MLLAGDTNPGAEVALYPVDWVRLVARASSAGFLVL